MKRNRKRNWIDHLRIRIRRTDGLGMLVAGIAIIATVTVLVYIFAITEK